MTWIQVKSQATGEVFRIADPFIVVCGFTAREDEVNAAHVRELQELGVAPPATVPLFMPVPFHLLLGSGGRVEVASHGTSGEAEPVLIRLTDGRYLLAVGSDHTDRLLEATSMLAGKLACPKPVGTAVWDLDEIGDRWDDLILSSAANGAPPHQQAPLAAIKPPMELLEALARAIDVPTERPLVVFMGTLAGSSGDIGASGTFSARLEDRASGRALECTYAFEDVTTLTRKVTA